jgi:hypothetical protein
MPDNRNSGFARVPGKPTADMLTAGMRAGGVNVDIAWRVFAIMVEVARQERAPITIETAQRRRDVDEQAPCTLYRFGPPL